MESTKPTILLKMVIMGSGGVGKTSLARTYVYQEFTQSYMQTLGEDVFSKELSIDDVNSKIIVNISDIAGQERFAKFRKMYMKKASFGLAVYDLTMPGSITSLKTEWLPELAEGLFDKFLLVLVGNKKDLQNERKISPEQAEELVEHIKNHYPIIRVISSIETSALTRENVDLAFESLVKGFLNIY